jgi:hypothetical protein
MTEERTSRLAPALGRSARRAGATPLKILQSAAELALTPAELLSDSFRQRAVLAETGHRPWPAPKQPWLMGQTWISLLFAHWRVPTPALEAVVPAQLQIDTYDSSAWIGVTPFLVRGLRLRGTTPLPWLSSFPEINVRTYVTVDAKPGIYFLSLDADSHAAVTAARRAYRLPTSTRESRPASKGTAFALTRCGRHPRGRRLTSTPGMAPKGGRWRSVTDRWSAG